MTATIAEKAPARTVPDVRYIQAWRHTGDSSLVHATIDQPEQRGLIALGRMGIFARTACDLRGSSWAGTPFMRVERSEADNPVRDEEGWIVDHDVHGRDWAADLPGRKRRCVRCERALRKIGR